MPDQENNTAEQLGLANDLFRVIPLSKGRRYVQNYLRSSAQTQGFAVLMSCDVERYISFVERCRAQKVRPPSLTAYIARCLGVVLQQNLEILAVQRGRQLLVPRQVNLMMVVETLSEEEEKLPTFLQISNIGHRRLDDIVLETTRRVRELKRQRIAIPHSRFFSSNSPQWWQRAGRTVKDRRGRMRPERLEAEMCVRLSSTTPWVQGRSVWGTPLYVSTALNVMMGGLAKRALVVDDEIVARTCLDIALNFDHEITDGAPATRFINALAEEIESGRALDEYKVEPRRARRVSDVS